MTEFTTRSGAAVPRWAFGTMQFGDKADVAASRAMYEACREAGIRHFDTAWVYTEGRSEEILGDLVGADRDELFIATKVGMTGGAGRDTIRKQLDESLARLKMPAVDLLYIHIHDPETPMAETVAALAEVKTEGRARHLALSNYASWQVMQMQHLARDAGTRVAALQPMYNLVKRQAEVELLPMCQDQDILPVPYSPLAGGLLTGKYMEGGTGRLTESDMYRKRYAIQGMHEAAKALSSLAAEAGTHPATLAAAWVARHPSRPAPILSARSAEQLAPSLAAIDYRLDDALYAKLSELYPAPPPATDRLEEVT
ncbi:aldo/keto reductase [Litorisediminicola beolgyonensis]|uniref:Aldo/keto reductase n=1 Tax=Litorisediminicola beolgyonensis TaxID=1173614 RepID=A0ABW3ZCM3_9RHOB